MDLSKLKLILKSNISNIEQWKQEKGFTWASVCLKLNLLEYNPEYIRGVYRSLNTTPGKTVYQTASQPVSVKVENDTTEIVINQDKPIRTLEELIKVCKIDTNEFTIEKWICNHWSGKYQVKAFLKRKEQGLSDLEQFFNIVLPNIKPLQFEYQPKVESKNLLVLGLYDVHFDKQSYDSSTHYESELFKYGSAALELVERAINTCSSLTDVWIPIGNDFFNTDTLFNTTTRGTQQSVTGNWTDVFQAAVRMYSSLINTLQSNYNINVSIIWTPGNHDYQKSFYLTEVLKAYFKESAKVEVLNENNYFKILQYGVTAIGFTHGDYAVKQLPLMFASKARDIWSSTKFAEVLTGHLHTNKKQSFMSADEFQGVQIRTLPALSSTDEWSRQNMYDDNLKKGVGLIYNFSAGKIAELYTF